MTAGELLLAIALILYIIKTLRELMGYGR